MFSRLNIRDKGLLVVSLPLLFELIFVVSLATLHHRAEEWASKERRSRELMQKVESVQRQLFNAGITLGSMVMRFDGLSSRFDNFKVQATTELESIRASIGDLSPAAQREYDSYEATMMQLVRALTLVKAELCQETEHEWSAASGGMLRTKVLRLLSSSSSQTDKLLSTVAADTSNFPAEQAKSRQLVDYCVYAGVSLNVILTLVLAVYFSKDITGRLAVVVDNFVQMSRGQSLGPTLRGADEIAVLDRSFRALATALGEAQRKERAITENAVDVICSISTDLYFGRSNSAVQAHWGWSPNDLVGVCLWDLICAEDRAFVQQAFDLARFAEDSTSSFEARTVNTDGALVWMSWSICWSQADETYFCVAHNVSDNKELEQLKRDFVNMVSHDLRTPLCSTQAFLQLLAAGAYGALSEKGVAATSRVQGSLTRLIALVRGLLDIERMEAGRLDLNMKPVAIRSILESSIEMVQGFADTQGVSLSIEQTVNATVMADEDRLIQVVQNFLSNAIKFSPHGAKVTLSAVQGEGDCIEVRVSDSGCGIPEEESALIFERFKQTSDGKKREGIGLGLAICKAIIEQHNGEIGVQSRVGQGSTFWFRLRVHASRGEPLGSLTAGEALCDGKNSDR